jgi:RNA polymerase sigma factor (sigma-70 family)
MTTSAVELVAGAADGDERCWSELFRRYDGLLRWVARGFRLSRDQVDDAAQTTWLQLVEHIGEVREPDKVGAWLAVTMRRQCIRVATRQRREEPRGEWGPEELGTDADVAGEVLRAERDADLWRAVDRLPPRQRLLLRALSATPQPSYQEVSRKLSMPVGSIGPIRARALRRLALMLHEDDGERPAVEPQLRAVPGR